MLRVDQSGEKENKSTNLMTDANVTQGEPRDWQGFVAPRSIQVPSEVGPAARQVIMLEGGLKDHPTSHFFLREARNLDF